ncbi:hypothetical protein MML48_1g02434 [Holotrichia oblita]|uniref:Uncharacterized protein n=1 Tax=Holotrichia oblita TaxID=644536 RepID=A0ACB9TS13_HOLOL|nr:hypothetical protein MML48_1g02434 [Holotrichia oblita]
MNLSAKLDELQRGDRHLETTVALCEIRSQLQELTKSVESCQSEVSEVKRDMVAIKHELDTVQQVKEEIEELREYVDRLEEHTHRRKLRLLEQVGSCSYVFGVIVTNLEKKHINMQNVMSFYSNLTSSNLRSSPV